MAEIALTRGMVALVDDGDLTWLSKWKWYAYRDPRSPSLFYARKNTSPSTMHGLILPCPPGFVPDHKNGNGLDNRRENLRLASFSQNAMNKRITPGVSGFRGVSFSRHRQKWQAKIRAEGKHYHLGYFSSAVAAAEAYDARAVSLHGAFACLNFDALGVG